MQKVSIQEALEIAKKDPNSVFANQLRRSIESGSLDKAAAQQGVDLTAYGRPKPTETIDQMIQDVNLGTGFKPTFESKAEDPFVVDVAKAIGNAPKSAYQLGKDVVTAVANPIDTGKAVVNLIEGASANVAQNTLENTEFGQSLLAKMNDVRIQNNLPELQRNEQGRFLIPDTEAMQVADQVGAYFADRYGGAENIRESIVEDPVGVLSDVAAVVSGAGAAVKTAGTASKSTRFANVGTRIRQAGDALEPTTAVTRGVSTAARGAANTLPGRIISEGAPTPGRFAEGEIVKALDLTQGDLSKISKTTGNDVADFITRNNILRETPEEIVFALDDLKTTQYTKVRDEVSKVPVVYTSVEVPRVTDALNAVRNVTEGVPGLEDVASEVSRLLQKDDYLLLDIQRAKELLDENTNIYTRAGDVGSAKTAQGLANIRSELRSFIEDEVSKATNGATDIQKLNNDVATSRELMNAIELRETRDLTRQYGGLITSMLGVGTFAGTGDLLTAIGVAGAAKLAQTPSFRIALARALKATPAQDLKRWSSEVAEGSLSPQTRQALSNIVREAQENAQFIQAGSQVVGEATATTTEEVTQ